METVLALVWLHSEKHCSLKGGGGGGGGGGCWPNLLFVLLSQTISAVAFWLTLAGLLLLLLLLLLLFVGCLTSQEHASVSQGRICSDKFYVLPHFDRSCRSNFIPQPGTVS